jgi:hypothetical protein
MVSQLRFGRSSLILNSSKASHSPHTKRIEIPISQLLKVSGVQLAHAAHRTESFANQISGSNVTMALQGQKRASSLAVVSISVSVIGGLISVNVRL